MDFNDFKNKYENVPVEQFPHQVLEKPLVSVCVLTYQHKSFIKECLDSILIQKTNFPIEILIGEDSSTDGTKEICIEYAEKYPNKIRLFLHHRENNIKINGSPTGRFNLLYSLFIARGKYIALCEGDDYWTDSYKLQKQVDFLEANNEYSICFTYSMKVDGDGKPLEAFSELKQKTFTQYDFLVGKKQQTRTQTILFNKDYLNIEKVLKMNSKNRINGDTVMKIQLTDNNKLGVRLPECTAAYRIHQGGIWSGLNKINLTKKNFYSWRAKLKIAINVNLNAYFTVLKKTLEYFVKWKLYTFLEMVKK